MGTERGRRKTRIGVVLSDKMEKTRVVTVQWSMPHPLYKRPVRHVTRFKAHDELNVSHVGDRVMLAETRRLSKDKRWRVVEVVERAEVMELKPEEIEKGLLEEIQPVAQAAPSPAGEETPATAGTAEAAAAEEPEKEQQS